MTEEEMAIQRGENHFLKPIRKITQGQDLFVDFEAFEDMDENTIEKEWGRSRGTTILPESSCKYDILERIDQANKELDQDILSVSSVDITSHSPCEDSSLRKRKLVHFSQLVHTAHYQSPSEGDYDEHDEIETAGYWSAEEISATPEQEVDKSEICRETNCCTRQVDLNRCLTPESPDNWYDSEDGSSVDLSALTDSVDRLDLSPLDTDSPVDTLRPSTPSLDSSPLLSLIKSGNYENDFNNRKVKNKNQQWNKLNMTSKNYSSNNNESNQWKYCENQMNRWNRTNIRINCWNLADPVRNVKPPGKNSELNLDKLKANCDGKTQRRVCLSRHDESRLPKYNGLRSEYGLSQQQLNERKRVKAEKRRQSHQCRVERKNEAEAKKKANEMVFNRWLDKKKQQENDTKKKGNKYSAVTKCSNTPQRAFSAHVTGSRKILNQPDYSKLGLLRRIMSASVNSPKEQMTYSIYLGLPLQRTQLKQF